MASALSLGGGFAGVHAAAGLIVSSRCQTESDARRWRPDTTPDGRIILFAGHIQNRAALRRELQVRAQTDAALYAAAYAAWGDVADLRVLGEFATLAIDLDRRQVRAARSPLLAPALHIWRDARRLMIGSAARVIFAAIDQRPEVDEQKIADSLYLNYCEEERGWFKGVQRIGIGTRTIITPGSLTTQRYYDPLAAPDVRFKRDSDYVDAAHTLLTEGTRGALDGFVAPAISLSGGLDSQAVAAYALTESPATTPILGLTSVPMPDWQNYLADRYVADERANVAALRDMYPALATEVIEAPDLAFDHRLDALFLICGVTPRNASNLYWIHELHTTAKARGCDVVLNGMMGNISFSFDGSGALPSWLARGKWRRLSREIGALRSGRSFTRTLLSHAIRPHLPDPLDRRLTRLRNPHAMDQSDEWCGLNPAYRRAMRVEERASDMGYDSQFRPARSPHAWRSAALDNALSEAGDLLPGLEALHGIPQRDPTAYRPLVELCFGMPDDQYLRDGKSRWLAKRLLKERIPDAVLNDRRCGVQAADWNLRLWRRREALRAELAALAEDPAMAERFDLPRLTAALDAWSEPTPKDMTAENTLHCALPRTLATARFIRFVSGANR